MEQKKIVLGLDWSNLMFRSLYINQIFGDKINYDKIEDCRSFIYKMTGDICSIINIFKPDNVVMLMDSKNVWRKKILEDYKATREHSDTINWNNIFQVVNELKMIFKSMGVHIAESPNAEADDMAALCKEVIWENFPNYNFIIVSADADLRQLLDWNPLTNQYCAVYNTITKGKSGKRYFYMSPECSEWFEKHEDPMAVFFGDIDQNRVYLKNIFEQNSKIEKDIEDPDEILIHKIFCGDDGDNIPAFYTWIANGKSQRITPSKEKKICEKLNIKNVNDLLKAEGGLKPVFETVCKKDINDLDFSERLKTQRTLVELKSELFPDSIQLYKAEIFNMLQELNARSIVFRAANILKGTQFEGYDQKKVLEANVFHNIDKYLNTTLF